MNNQQAPQSSWKWDCVPSGCGVLAIRRDSDGKSYFLAVRDMRQRVYDAVRMLRAGKHHNRELQSAWMTAPNDFQIVVVETVRCPTMLSLFKQVHMERARNNCFNLKSGISTC